MYKCTSINRKAQRLQYSIGGPQFHTPSKWNEAYHLIYRSTEFPRFREMVSGQAHLHSRTP